MDKKLIIGLVVAGAILAGAGIWFAQKNDAEPVMTIGRYYWPGQYWVEVAYEKGWFEEEGLNVELVDSNADYRGSLDDVVNGTLDTQNFYVFDMVSYVAQGADLQMVINADTSAGAEAVIMREGVSSVEGLRIGVEEGLATEYILYTLAKQSKVDLQDVSIVTARSEELPQRFKDGEVDAVVLWEPLATEALERPNSIRAWDTSKAPGLISAGYVFRKDFIEERGDDVRAFVRVWHRTTQFIRENPDEAYAIVARVNNDTVENVRAYTEMDKTLDLNDNLKAFSYSGGFKSLYGQIKLVNLYLSEKGVIDTDIEARNVLAPTYIQELGLE